MIDPKDLEDGRVYVVRLPIKRSKRELLALFLRGYWCLAGDVSSGPQVFAAEQANYVIVRKIEGVRVETGLAGAARRPCVRRYATLG
jgi:hypothetical protein